MAASATDRGHHSRGAVTVREIAPFANFVNRRCSAGG